MIHNDNQETRPDGLIIFPSGDDRLDKIRKIAPHKRDVIMAVALDVAHAVACNYARTYAPEEEKEISKIFQDMNKRVDQLEFGKLLLGNKFEL